MRMSTLEPSAVRLSTSGAPSFGKESSAAYNSAFVYAVATTAGGWLKCCWNAKRMSAVVAHDGEHVVTESPGLDRSDARDIEQLHPTAGLGRRDGGECLVVEHHVRGHLRGLGLSG